MHRIRFAAVVVAAGLALRGMPAGAQMIGDTTVLRALELEGTGQPRAAAPLYLRALAGPEPIVALLGLERIYAELGITDSLLAPLGDVVTRHPADATVRTVQLRTLRAAGRITDVRTAAAEWMRHAPRDPAPFRELARILLAEGQARAADSVIAAAQRTLGSVAALAPEVAEVRAAAGDWEGAARAWRTALRTDRWRAESAAHALADAPAARRDSLRAILLNAPLEAAARLALASLEARWGAPARGWVALRDLPPDSSAAAAWLAYGETAERDARWADARAAFEAALRWRPSAELRQRTAIAALESGDARAAIALAPLGSVTGDSAALAEWLVPLHVRALAALGQPDEAAQLAAAFDRFLAPAPRALLARAVAMAWVRAGDLPRARASLAAAGAGADSSSAAGWIALYEGDAAAARSLLAEGEERSADVAVVLAVLARHRGPRAAEIGAAFLALARGDSAAAAGAFDRAAGSAPAAASLLRLTAARIRLVAGDSAGARQAFERITTEHADTPEAPEALLALGRLLLAAAEPARGIAQLERLVLSHPESALVPVARAELEAAGRLISRTP